MKLKDLFTLGNLLSGYASVLVLFLVDNPRDAFVWACYLIYLGWFFDTLDGPIARLTKQFDTFGGIFVSLCDFITNSIAPGFIIFHYYTYIGGFHWAIGAAIGAFPVALGTLRQAKQDDKPMSYPCYFLGVPRPVMTFFVLAMLNSSMFQLGAASPSPWGQIVYGIGALLIIVLCFLHLSKIPFVSHHDRRWMYMLRFGVHMFRTVAPVVLLLGWLLLDWARVFYDYLFFCMLVYVGISWTQIPREDWTRIRSYVAGGPLVLPLVHDYNKWIAKTMNPLFCDPPATREEGGDQ